MSTRYSPDGTARAARSTTAPTATRPGAPTSPARRTGPATSAASPRPTTRSAPPKELACLQPLRRRRAPAAALGHRRRRRSRRHHRSRAGTPRSSAPRPTAATTSATRQHLRLGGRDRSVQSDLDAAEAHRAGPLRPRGRLAGPSSPAGRSSLHGRRLAQRVHLQVRLERQTGTRPTPTRGLAAGDKYLDAGTLYVAKFDADGTGTWLQLAFGVNGITGAQPAYAFADQADMLVNTRLAADAVGATKMDRPEWGGGEPEQRRGLPDAHQQQQRAAPARRHRRGQPALLQRPDRRSGDRPARQPQRPHHPLAPRPATTRPRPSRGTSTCSARAPRADPDEHQHLGPHRQQRLLEPRRPVVQQASGLLWIQTDDGAYTDVTNCMMLAALPGERRRRRDETITNVDGAATKATWTRTWARRWATASCAASSSARRTARSPASPRRRTARRCSSTSSIRARTTSAANFATGDFISNWPDGGGARRPRRPRSSSPQRRRRGGRRARLSTLEGSPLVARRAPSLAGLLLFALGAPSASAAGCRARPHTLRWDICAPLPLATPGQWRPSIRWFALLTRSAPPINRVSPMSFAFLGDSAFRR